MCVRCLHHPCSTCTDRIPVELKWDREDDAEWDSGNCVCLCCREAYIQEQQATEEYWTQARDEWSGGTWGSSSSQRGRHTSSRGSANRARSSSGRDRWKRPRHRSTDQRGAPQGTVESSGRGWQQDAEPVRDPVWDEPRHPWALDGRSESPWDKYVPLTHSSGQEPRGRTTVAFRGLGGAAPRGALLPVPDGRSQSCRPLPASTPLVPAQDDTQDYKSTMRLLDLPFDEQYWRTCPVFIMMCLGGRWAPPGPPWYGGVQAFMCASKQTYRWYAVWNGTRCHQCNRIAYYPREVANTAGYMVKLCAACVQDVCESFHFDLPAGSVLDAPSPSSLPRTELLPTGGEQQPIWSTEVRDAAGYPEAGSTQSCTINRGIMRRQEDGTQHEIQHRFSQFS